MTIQLGATLRNAMINVYETTINAAPVLRIHSGIQPADITTAHASGTLLDTITLPSDWMAIVGSQTGTDAGKIQKNNVWAGGGASAAGTAGHYRLWNAALTVCHEQGSVGMGSGDLSLDNTNIGLGQIVTITSWNRTQGGA